MLTKSTQYAIRALVYIQLQNWYNQRPGVLEIAREIEAPEAYTAKILQRLTKNHLLDSAKGRGGGFFFSDQDLILTLYEVVLVMEGDAGFHQCGFGLKDCNEKNPCPLHDRYLAVRDGFFQITKTESIQSLARKIVKGEAVLNRMV